MMRSLFDTVRRSIMFYRKDAVNQVIIVALLAAIITGSFFTGHSVRASLRKSAAEKIGNTRIVINAGLRFFDASLAQRITGETQEKTASILETDGYCQNFSTGVTALNTKIYGITDDFWSFHEFSPVKLPSGTVAVNSTLASHLGISAGDEIIIKFRDVDPIPSNAPFAPSKTDDDASLVMKVGTVLNPDQKSNFSLGISQIVPMNVFINLSDLDNNKSASFRANRLLVQNSGDHQVSFFSDALSRILSPSDIGLTVRKSLKTGETELISDRIFIDSAIVEDIRSEISSAAPVITYLGNNFQVDGRSAPYSFVTAFYNRDIGESEIEINKWLADDLDAGTGDTLTMTWYVQGFNNLLEEKSKDFLISDILPDDHLYADPLLMPEFPGISGKTTCSGWDAGIPLLLENIRDKDEEYWNDYKGTPKAFINYSTGRKLWGNIFGTATAIRFPETENPEEIINRLTGTLEPSKTGFTITDINKKVKKATGESVDFSTLFLSLAIFIIVSCLILLSLAVSMFFDSRKVQVRTYFSLGFRNRRIRNILLSETVIISAAGAFTGVFMGYVLNILIIKALNSVWHGAVQTNTLSADFNYLPLLAGFVSTMIISSFLLLIKSGKFLRSLSMKETGELKGHSPNLNFVLFLSSSFIFVFMIVLSFLVKGNATIFSFAAGTFLFIILVLALRQYYIRRKETSSASGKLKRNFEKQFYSFHPAHAITPVIFIAAGIFAVIITGANRQVISDKMLLPSGGTGGYLLWAESAVPVKENLVSPEGRREFGLDESDLEDLVLTQAKRLPGDDASCLNLNHVTAPSILGIDTDAFISKGSFSFASQLKGSEDRNPWSLLKEKPASNTIYGIADQTVLEWGLKLKTGDTLIYVGENGQPLNIVICAGLKSSVFQGYLLIGSRNFGLYFPSVSGNSIFLAEGDPELSDYYIETLSERLSGYGLSIEPASRKLASFFVVTNTYLDVFTVLGALGLVLGVIGLGFILIRNFNQRKREFALMMATGYTNRQIKSRILNDQMIILIYGVITGSLSGLTATMQSLRSGSEIPWFIIMTMIILILAAGFMTIFFSVRTVRSTSLVTQLRKE